jgi:hypothetical protein
MSTNTAPVCGADDDHARVARARHAVKLHQELRLEPPRRVVFARAARAKQRVDLIHEDDRRRSLHGHGEERAHLAGLHV